MRARLPRVTAGSADLAASAANSPSEPSALSPLVDIDIKREVPLPAGLYRHLARRYSTNCRSLRRIRGASPRSRRALTEQPQPATVMSLLGGLSRHGTFQHAFVPAWHAALLSQRVAAGQTGRAA